MCHPIFFFQSFFYIKKFCKFIIFSSVFLKIYDESIVEMSGGSRICEDFLYFVSLDGTVLILHCCDIVCSSSGISAGLILLSEEIDTGEPANLDTLPVTVKRNAYGRQLGSFCTTADLTEIPAFPMVFIRAPYIASVKEPVKVLGTVDDHIIAVQYKHQIGLSFHPELTGYTRIHKYFVDMVRNVI